MDWGVGGELEWIGCSHAPFFQNSLNKLRLHTNISQNESDPTKFKGVETQNVFPTGVKGLPVGESLGTYEYHQGAKCLASGVPRLWAGAF